MHPRGDIHVTTLHSPGTFDSFACTLSTSTWECPVTSDWTDDGWLLHWVLLTGRLWQPRTILLQVDKHVQNKCFWWSGDQDTQQQICSKLGLYPWGLIRETFCLLSGNFIEQRKEKTYFCKILKPQENRRDPSAAGSIKIYPTIQVNLVWFSAYCAVTSQGTYFKGSSVSADMDECDRPQEGENGVSFIPTIL